MVLWVAGAADLVADRVVDIAADMAGGTAAEDIAVVESQPGIAGI